MTTPCPYCRQQIDSSATVCPYCSSNLTESWEWIFRGLGGFIIVVLLLCYFIWVYAKPFRYAIANLGDEKVVATIEIYDGHKSGPITDFDVDDYLSKAPKIIFNETFAYRYSPFDNNVKRATRNYIKCTEKLIKVLHNQYPNAKPLHGNEIFGPVDDRGEKPEYRYEDFRKLYEDLAYKRKDIFLEFYTPATDSRSFRDKTIFLVCRHETRLPKNIKYLLKSN